MCYYFESLGILAGADLLPGFMPLGSSLHYLMVTVIELSVLPIKFSCMAGMDELYVWRLKKICWTAFHRRLMTHRAALYTFKNWSF